MEKKYFFLKLNPPRVSFMTDMTQDERLVMQQHVEYWKPFVADGTVIVLDPSGGYGIAVVVVEDENQLNSLILKDPANGLNSYSISPMKAVSKMIKDK